MRKLILPLILLLLGLGLGAGAGWFLRPGAAPTAAASAVDDSPKLSEYMKFPKEFIIPLLEHGRVAGMVVMQLGLEVPQGKSAEVLVLEPKLRDEALRVLFEHANAGGFRGNFTDAANLIPLRRALLEASQKIAGPQVQDVLITDLARQDS